MAVQTTSNLSNSVRARYQNRYETTIFYNRVYDRLAEPVGKDMAKFIAGSSIVMPFLSKMDIGTGTISETADVVPQSLVDATVSITPTSRGEALQQSELIRIQNYAENFEQETMQAVAENATESIDLVAQAQALKGSLLLRATARASLDAGTAGHNLTEAEFDKAGNMLYEFKVPQWMPGGDENEANGVSPGAWFAIIPPDAYYDLRNDSNIVAIAQYQDPSIVFRHEVGSLGKFKLIVAPWAKVFGGAGADNGSNAATTLASAATKLDKTIEVASATNITVGRYITVGTEETADTHYETNERVRVASASGTTITIVGAGSNGGLRFNHASGAAVRNADSVYPVVFGGPRSLKKWWNPGTGEFGQIVVDNEVGLLDQWYSRGWKWYGAYARPIENRLVRGEYSSSLDG
jgi:N4-gp56 family major capsid protein